MADAVLIEQFSEFISNNDSDSNVFIFVTHNHNDFSSKDHRQPHEDFSDIFHKDNVHYFNNAFSAIKSVDDEVLEDILFDPIQLQICPDSERPESLGYLEKVWYQRSR